MSYKTSNLYASKVFAEHPLALWPIDESINYLSIISASAKAISATEWTKYNLTSYNNIDNPLESFPSQNPIEGSIVNRLEKNSNSIDEISATFENIEYISLDSSKGSICFSSYIYIPSQSLVSAVEIGIELDGNKHYTRYEVFNNDDWIKIEHRQDMSSVDILNPYIKIEYSALANSGENTAVFLAGISLGQWSELYNSYDTGSYTVDLPTNIYGILGLNSGSLQCIELDPYGFNDQDTGYAIKHENSFLVETSGVPMIYGSRNSISILGGMQENTFSSVVSGGSPETYDFNNMIDGGDPSSIYDVSLDGGTVLNHLKVPSLIFPGKGFLNQSGIYSNLTAEFWMRINSESIDEIKIFGPITSDDGLYVKGQFLTVKVGKYIKSYFIGQWYRPMLVHFGQTLDEIYLLINGEKVISIKIDSLDISTFPPADEDYLGFYGSESIHPFEIDIFSIFPYIITKQIAKIRFVYGQGVETQESVISSLGGDLTYIDFPYAGYSSTISYPDRTPWTNGYSNNLSVTKSGLTYKDFTLPNTIFTNKSASISQGEAEVIWSNFEYDNYSIQDEIYPFMSMIPNNNYLNFDSTIFFSNMNKTGYPTKSIYSVLKTSDDVSTNQSILYISNNINTNYFEVKINSGSIQYIYNDDIITSASIGINSEFVVGFDIDKICENYPQTNQFFSNLDSVSLNFAGINGDMFLGKIFSLTINNEFYTEKDSYLFNVNGFAIPNILMYSYIGSYTLVPKQTNLTVFFDIATSGYWEASVPLSYFGKYITAKNGSKYYDLDLIQFNIDIPSTLYSRDTEDSLLYQNNMLAKSYITIQNKQNVGMVPYTDYINTVNIGNSRVLDFDSENDLDSTKFEVCDSTVIFPPKNDVDFKDYYITIHIELTSSGINSENIVVKNMSLSSLAFDESSFYDIKSPTGRNIYPISKVDNNYIYKTKNPVVISNESSPYLYTSGNSGISVMPQDDLEFMNAISFPINQTLKSDFNMVGFQIYLMFNEYDIFPEQKLIGRYFNNTYDYSIYLIPELDQKRAIVKVFDSSTGIEIDGIKFFINGKDVSTPIINPFKWNSILLSLQENSLAFYNEVSPGVFEGISGQLEIYPGVRVDNVSIFSDINEIKTSLSISNTWFDITELGAATWTYMSSLSWQNVQNEQFIPVTVLSVDGNSIYDTYNGLSYAITSDSSTLNVNFDSINVLNDADWSTFEYKPI